MRPHSAPYRSEDVQTENGEYELLIEADGSEVGYIKNPDDARIIVHCCNMFEPLLVALENLQHEAINNPEKLNNVHNPIWSQVADTLEKAKSEL